MPVKAMDLFDAFAKNAIPTDKGYLLSSFFLVPSAYCRYELVAYEGLRSINPNEEGLGFRAESRKLHILVEPADYHYKGMEPCARPGAERMPHRFGELETHVCGNGTKIYYSKEPVTLDGSFMVQRPTGVDFCFLFYALPDAPASLGLFFERTFSGEAGIPSVDAGKVAAALAEKISAAMPWNSRAG